MKLLRYLCLIGLAWLVGCGTGRDPRAGTAPPGAPPYEAAEEAPPIDADALAREVHALVNQARARHDRAPLRWDDRLAALARTHSLDMGRRGFFAHVNPEGEDATQRGLRAGIECQKRRGTRIYFGVAENLYSTTRYSAYRIMRSSDETRRVYQWKDPQALAREIVEGWMQSPGHRANLLSAVYDAQGIGVALFEEEVFVTQNFC